ncbi:hypothetical protein [Mesorhizobium japonicum]|nr:hypothetical protein [Mesorhizobium japonicum]
MPTPGGRRACSRKWSPSPAARAPASADADSILDATRVQLSSLSGDGLTLSRVRVPSRYTHLV